MKTPPSITHAQNDLLFDETGREIIDLFSANGTTWLGHANPAITQPLAAQLNRVWLTGGLPPPSLAAARSALDALLPPTHATAAVYSTGMEAAEFAFRIARAHTHRNGAVGFSHNMHGKSLATSSLCWDNAPTLPGFLRLPFVDTTPESQILHQLTHALSQGTIGAVFMEPLLGSAGGHSVSTDFCEKLLALCRAHNTLSIFDELLSGFHRTGPRFFSSSLSQQPDILLLGKSLANGFPASAVIARRDIPITPAMLPGSTFAANPLACTAIHATLTAMSLLDLTSISLHIATRIQVSLSPLPGIILRGQGAIWMLELPSNISPESIARRCFARGVFLSFTGKFLRILPAATITDAHLTTALQILKQELTEALHA